MSNRTCQKKLLCCPNHLMSSTLDIKDLSIQFHHVIPTEDALEAIALLDSAQVLINKAGEVLMRNVIPE